MIELEKAVFNWSGGKDSALALRRFLDGRTHAVSHLLTSVNSAAGRVSMHGVRTELAERQAASIGIPLVKVLLPEMPGMETYERLMDKALRELKAAGVSVSVFGDIFLQDLRQYREEKLAMIGLRASFPLWKIPSADLMREFLESGFKAVVVCVSEMHLDRGFAGRTIDEEFLNDLPPSVDPCGENGEYHSFVYDGPIFTKPVNFTKGEIVYREYRTPRPAAAPSGDGTPDPDQPPNSGYWYCDLLCGADWEARL